ncbi:MAG: tetratricopeptide repeat protein [Phycisphaerales bacterium]|nr:tetratricopeptide repeat protein [Phycisphaerales bacterium]
MLGWLVENTLLACLVAVPMLLLEQRWRGRPAVCHTIWVTVLLVLLLPPVELSSPVAIRGHFRESFVELETSAWLRLERLDPSGDWAESRPSVPAMARELEWGEIGPDYVGGGEEAALTLGSSGDHAGVLPPIRQSSSAPSPAPTVIRRGWIDLPTPAATGAFFRTVWLGGAAVSLSVFLWRVRRVDRLVRQSRQPGAALRERVQQVAGRLGVRMPELRAFPGVGTPMVWGLGRPVMLWPEGISCGEEGSVGLMAHELAHLRRRDHWIACVQVFASALLWWHPLARLAARRIERYAELACDAWAVKAVDGRRRDYAEAIIGVVERLGQARRPAPALAASGAGQGALVERLWVVMAARATARGSRTILAAAVAMVALLLPTMSTGEARQAASDELPALDERVREVALLAALKREGDDWFEARAWTAADGAYRAALRLDAKDAGTSARLGIVLVHLGELDEAERLIRRSVELDGRKAEWRYWLGVLAARRGETETALREVERAMRLGMDVAERLESESALADVQAIAVWREFVERARRVHELRERTRAHMKAHEAEAALAALDELSALCAEDGATWHLLSYCALAIKRFDEAERALQRQKELGYRLGVQAYNEACLRALRGRPDEAVEAFERAVDEGFMDYALARSDPDLESIRGNARFVRALSRVTEVEKMKRQLALAREFYEWDRVLELCAQAEVMGSRRFEWMIERERANALAESGRHGQAREVLIAAMREGMNAGEGLFELARVEAMAGRTDEAAAGLRAAGLAGMRDAERVRADARVSNLLARGAVQTAMYDAVARVELARFGVKTWEELARQADERLAADAGDRDALHRRGWAKLRLGDYAAAQEDFEALHAAGWRAPVSAYNVACALAQQGQKTAALEWLERAVADGMDDAEMIAGDRDLKTLRDDAAFKALLGRLRETAVAGKP